MRRAGDVPSCTFCPLCGSMVCWHRREPSAGSPDVLNRRLAVFFLTPLFLSIVTSMALDP